MPFSLISARVPASRTGSDAWRRLEAERLDRLYPNPDLPLRADRQYTDEAGVYRPEFDLPSTEFHSPSPSERFLNAYRANGYLQTAPARPWHTPIIDQRALGARDNMAGKMAPFSQGLPNPSIRQASLQSGQTAPQIVYRNDGAIRSQPLNSKLEAILRDAAAAAGVDQVVVFSGGQPSHGENRTGSHRHDNGMSGDVRLYSNGRPINFMDPAGEAIFATFAQTAAALGATGIGAGKGYMDQGGVPGLAIHVGFGSKAVWGRGGASKNAPSWLTAAVNQGWGNPRAPGNVAGVVNKNSSRAAVESLQRTLIQAGFNPGIVDGKYGSKTEAAVKAFQQAAGFSGKDIDGVAGPKTFAALAQRAPNAAGANAASLYAQRTTASPTQLARLPQPRPVQPGDVPAATQFAGRPVSPAGALPAAATQFAGNMVPPTAYPGAPSTALASYNPLSSANTGKPVTPTLMASYNPLTSANTGSPRAPQSPPHTIASAEVPAAFEREQAVTFINDFVGKALEAYKSGVPREQILATVFPDATQRTAAESLLGAIGESAVTGMSMAKMFGGNIDAQIGAVIDKLTPSQRAAAAVVIGGTPTTVSSRMPTPRPDTSLVLPPIATRGMPNTGDVRPAPTSNPYTAYAAPRSSPASPALSQPVRSAPTSNPYTAYAAPRPAPTPSAPAASPIRPAPTTNPYTAYAAPRSPSSTLGNPGPWPTQAEQRALTAPTVPGVTPRQVQTASYPASNLGNDIGGGAPISAIGGGVRPPSAALTQPVRLAPTTNPYTAYAAPRPQYETITTPGTPGTPAVMGPAPVAPVASPLPNTFADYARMAAAYSPPNKVAPVPKPVVITPAIPGTPATTTQRQIPSEAIRQLQTQLQWAGLYTGRIDGLDGPLTQAAITAANTARAVPPGAPAVAVPVPVRVPVPVPVRAPSSSSGSSTPSGRTTPSGISYPSRDYSGNPYGSSSYGTGYAGSGSVTGNSSRGYI